MTDIIETSQQGAPGPVALSVPNAATLSAAPTNTYLAGTLAFIQPVSSSVPGTYYSLAPNSTATPDGVTVIAAANGGNWLLFGALGIQSVIQVVVGTSPSYSSTNTIPANAYVTGVDLQVNTGYSNGTIAVSNGATVVFTNDLPTTAGTYTSSLTASWGAASAAVSVSLTGSPSTGAAVVLVFYSVPIS